MLSLLLPLLVATPVQDLHVGPGSDVVRHREEASTAKLERLQKELFDAQLARRPWLAAELGIGGKKLRYGRYGSDGRTWWRGLLDVVDGELAGVRREDLKPAQRAVFDGLRGWVRAESILAAAQSRERLDPTVYVETVDRCISVLVEGDVPDVIQRSVEVGALLRELPAVWEAARTGLIAPSREWTFEAAERLHDLGLYIEIVVPSAFESLPWQPGVRERFDRFRSNALLETENFRTYLLDLRGGPTPAIGSGDWETLMQASTGAGKSIRELRSELLLDLAEYDRLLGSLRELIPAKEDRLQPDEVRERMAQTSARALRVAAESGVLPPESVNLKLLARVRPGQSKPSELLRIRAAQAGTWILDIEAPGPEWSAAVARTRRARLAPRAQDIIAIRDGIPGTALLYASSFSNRQRTFYQRGNFEGWGLYVLDWLQRIDWVDNPFAKDPVFRAEAQRAWMIEASRLLAAIEIHAEGRPQAEVVQNLARRTGFDAETATLEVRRAQHDPLYGIGYLGWKEIRRLEEELNNSLPPSKAIRRAVSLIRLRPVARPKDVLRNVFSVRSR